MSENCVRCKVKPMVYTCENCRPYTDFCVSCDNFVHTLPSKKNHKRILVNPDFLNNNVSGMKLKSNEEVNDRYSNSNVYEKAETQTEEVYLNSKKKEIKIEDENLGTKVNTSKHNQGSNSSTNPYQNNLGSPQQRDNHRAFSNFSPISQHSTGNKVFNSSHSYYPGTGNDKPERGDNERTDVYVNHNYSREYVTELKNLFDREKNELLMKNAYLQNNYDRLKVSLSEQINLLQSQTDEMSHKSNKTVKLLEDEFDLKLEKLENEKELEIKNLLVTISTLEDQNLTLNQKLNDYKDNNKILKHKIQDLNNYVREKDELIENMKEEHEYQIDELKNYFEKERCNLIKTYEDTIQKNHRLEQENKDHMNRIMREKEKELSNILAKGREDEIIYGKDLDELKKDLSYYKEAYEKMRIKISNLEHENTDQKLFIDRVSRIDDVHKGEIDYLTSEKRKLIDQNEDLRTEAKKLNTILYGRNSYLN